MSNKACKKTTIAGQALIEGILMRGPKQTAIVCRKPGEEMVVKMEPAGTMSHGAWARLPIIRGVVSFWDSMKFGMSALMYSADFFEEEEAESQSKFDRWLESKFSEETLEKVMMGTALVFGIAMPIDLHTHSTTGLAFMTYLKAVEAGVDIIDTAISPFSGGTSQPATETLAYALRQLGYEVDIDDTQTKKMADYFKTVRDDFIKDGTLMPKSMATDTQCLTYQIPGGMLSNLLSQLKQMNALDRLDEALLETPKVRKDMGYPPLVTPTSQMVGVQAVRNVLDGQRYKTVSKEIKAYCRGEYGKTPAPIDPEIQKQILGDEKPLTGRYADSLKPVVEDTRKKLGDLAKTDEDVLSYIAFPNLAEKFLEERKAKEENVATYTIVEC